MPCIMEGETGVSKTALTRMLFILKNGHSSVADAGDGTEALSGPGLRLIVKQVTELLPPQQRQMLNEGRLPTDEVSRPALHRLATNLLGLVPDDGLTAPQLASFISTDASVELIEQIRLLLLSELRAHPGLDHFDSQGVCIDDVRRLDAGPSGVVIGIDVEATECLSSVLLWYVRSIATIPSQLSWAFHQLNVHAALSPDDIVADLTPTIERAKRLEQLDGLLDSEKHRNTRLCVFLDEVRLSYQIAIPVAQGLFECTTRSAGQHEQLYGGVQRADRRPTARWGRHSSQYCNHRCMQPRT